jgi:glutathione S-transferase
MAIKPLRLHTMELAWRPNPLKAAILLEALGTPYTVKQWVSGTMANAVEGQAFLQLNPHGRTPVIEDQNTDTVVWESGAVLEYILRKYDVTNTFGSQPGDQARAEFDSWNHHILTTLAPAMSELNYFKQQGNSGAAQHFEDTVKRSLSALNALVEGNGHYLTGDHFTALDMNAFPWINIATMLGLSLKAYPGLERWLHSCQKEKSVENAMKKIENGDKP